VGGTRTTTYGAAGHLEEVDAAGNVIDLTTDDAGRLARLDRSGEAATFAYDGRGYLRRAEDLVEGTVVQPLYSSDGLLHALLRQPPGGAPEERTTVLYLAGRPVAQLLQVDTTTTWTYLTTDHLGTPLLATDETGAELWKAAFEPFGRDPWQGTPQGALAAGIFLRFPGQWEDEVWHEAALGSEVYYNVWRWLEVGTGRYTRVDPLDGQGDPNPYAYSLSNPVARSDPAGLKTCTSIIGDVVGSFGPVGVAMAGHVALYVDGQCGGRCDSAGPFLYDPGGSYVARHDAGSGDLLDSSVSSWSFDDFMDYHCEPGTIIETYCFDTSCCEEREILNNATDLGGVTGGLCSRAVSSATAGVGPIPGQFSSPLNTAPARFRRVIRRLFEQGQGGSMQTRLCGKNR